MELSGLLQSWSEIDLWAVQTIDRIAADVSRQTAMTTPIDDGHFESDHNGALSHEVDTSAGAMA